MPNSVVMKVDTAQVLRGFENVKKRTRDTGMRRALYAGAVIIRDAARSLVRVRYGLLKRQIGATSGKSKVGAPISASVGIFKGRFAVAGAKTRFGVAYGTKFRKVKALTNRSAFVNPRLYAHLVEFGTVHSRAFSFLGRANSSNGPRALAEAARVFKQFLETEAVA